MKYLYSILIIVGLSCMAHSQTEQSNGEDLNEQEEKHSLGIVISHSYISQGIIDGKREWLAAPSFGLNYNYKLNDKWSIGFHNDIIIESFIVENAEVSEEFLEREFPVSNLIVGTYKVTEAFGIALGTGVEWENNASFALIRIGADYAVGLRNKSIEVTFSLNYDSLINAYDSLNFGLGINKSF